MKRRSFLRYCAASPLAAGLCGPALAAVPAAAAALFQAKQGWRIYQLDTAISVPAAAAPARIWLPLVAAAAGDYQRTLSTEWSASGASAGVLSSPRNDAGMLALSWPAGQNNREPLAAKLSQVVAVKDRSVRFGAGPAASGASKQEPLEYLKPTRLLPTDGIVRAVARDITAGTSDTVAKARLIYEWVIDHTCRDDSVAGCGTGDVVKMLKTGGIMSGKCADINGLYVALARAVGIPARDAYGIRVDASRYGLRSLGASGDVSKAQHCRAEFYSAGQGWIPVDPADVRKVALDEAPGGLPMTDGRVQAARERLFGAWEMNWVVYNHGQDVRLAGDASMLLPFLMYPAGVTAAGTLDSVDPRRFTYRIESHRLA